MPWNEVYSAYAFEVVLPEWPHHPRRRRHFFVCFIIPHPLLSRDLKSWVLFLKNVLEESERGMRVILHILTAGEDMAVECLALRFLHHKKDSDVVRVEITLWNPNVLL